MAYQKQKNFKLSIIEEVLPTYEAIEWLIKSYNAASMTLQIEMVSLQKIRWVHQRAHLFSLSAELQDHLLFLQSNCAK